MKKEHIKAEDKFQKIIEMDENGTGTHAVSAKFTRKQYRFLKFVSKITGKPVRIILRDMVDVMISMAINSPKYNDFDKEEEIE